MLYDGHGRHHVLVSVIMKPAATLRAGLCIGFDAMTVNESVHEIEHGSDEDEIVQRSFAPASREYLFRISGGDPLLSQGKLPSVDEKWSQAGISISEPRVAHKPLDQRRLATEHLSGRRVRFETIDTGVQTRDECSDKLPFRD
jgi:hypothetical protein